MKDKKLLSLIIILLFFIFYINYYQISNIKFVPVLEIKNLNLKIESKEIIKSVNTSFETWKIYCLLWQNGSWKSSLSWAIAWNPKYSNFSWDILINWKSIKDLSPDERSSTGIFLAFQNIPEIPWIKLIEFLRVIYNNKKSQTLKDFNPLSPFLFKRFIQKFIKEIWIDESFLNRDLNVWFSWWEKRKIEVLQMKLLEPKYIILDEIDSWLDLNSVKSVSKMLSEIASQDNTFIIITHNFWILESLNVDKVLIMKAWEITEKWDRDLINKIKENGFK